MSEIQKYVSLMRLTQKGLTELTDSAQRRKVSEDRVAALDVIAIERVVGLYAAPDKGALGL